MTTSLARLRRDLKAHANPEKAAFLPKFFRTGKGEYGEGDKFLGLTVPACRQVARSHHDLSLSDTEKLLASRWHEERLTALIILVEQYRKADEALRQLIFDFYWRNRARVNNWDLVDSSAPQIVGTHLLSRSRKPLYQLARAPLIWDRRIAIVATHAFIRKGELEDTFALADLLLVDEHDLIHKAVGWMLREAGKKDIKRLENFLKDRYPKMPRTMLRYAIEKMTSTRRKAYLLGKI